ncbi:MAG: hypothetical protein ACLFP6_13090 [Spirochaetaceae bacterium]
MKRNARMVGPYLLRPMAIILLLASALLLVACANPTGAGGDAGSPEAESPGDDGETGGGNDGGNGTGSGGSGGNAGYTGPLVTSSANDGSGSLRQVVADAPEGSEVRFLEDMTITLSGDRQGIRIDKDLTISGVNANVVITTEGRQRHFTYQPETAALTLRHLTLRDGAPQIQALLPGGSIYVGAGSSLTAENVLFESNLGTLGGAIFGEENASGAVISVSGSTFRNNEARGISSSEVVGNNADEVAPFRGAGGAIYQRYGTLTVTGSEFVGNFVDLGHNLFISDGLSGGAIFVWDNTLAVRSTEFISNRAGRLGGAILSKSTEAEVVDSTFSENSAGAFGTDESSGAIGGGAIYASGPAAEVRVGLSSFIRNSAAGADDGSSSNTRFVGGAIATEDFVSMTVHASQFFGNSARDTHTTAPNTGGAISFAGGTRGSNPPSRLEIASTAFVGNTVAGSYDGGETGVAGVVSFDSGNEVEVSFSSFFDNLRLGGGDGHSDLEIGSDGYFLLNTTFEDDGFDPPPPDNITATIERVIAPFSEFDNENYQTQHFEGVDLELGNLNEQPQVNLRPNIGADNLWGTADDYYGDLLPFIPPGGNPNLYDRGESADLPADSLDLDQDGNKNEPLPFDAAGRDRSVSAKPDIGAYERQ